jgi:hypothetical protein
VIAAATGEAGIASVAFVGMIVAFLGGLVFLLLTRPPR